jgi:hypothetical protein
LVKGRLHRRDFLAAASAALVGFSTPSFAWAQGASLRAAAREAWLYLLPLVEVAAVRTRVLAAGPANDLIHQRELTSVATQRVTSPNNDTLYSRAFLDLTDGPVEIALPPTGDRYLSVALMDMFTNNFALLGTRTTGRDGGRFQIFGPGQPAPAGAIRAPSSSAFLLVRTLVAGADDLQAAHALQDRIRLDGPAARRRWAEAPTRDAAWPDYFESAGRILAETGAPAMDGALFERIAPLGLTPSGFRPEAFSADEQAEIEAGVAEARTLVLEPRGGLYPAQGWLYPHPNLGRFEQDYPYRAQIALTGLFALPLDEAVYTRSIGDRSDGLLHGDAYRLHFPADRLPPVDGFWSLTAYEARPDGQFFFTPNAINRYSIGDRTAGLQRGADNSLDIWIMRGDPGPVRRANWLPAPSSAPFMLSMRAFLPRPELSAGTYRYPALQRIA